MKNEYGKMDKMSISGRRGAAMEMAIFMMAVVFALSVLIVTLTYCIRVNGIHASDALIDCVELDMIGESFASSDDRDNFTIDESNGKYRIIIESDSGNDTLKVYNRDTGKLELTVKVGDGAIIKWSYSQNESGE